MPKRSYVYRPDEYAYTPKTQAEWHTEYLAARPDMYTPGTATYALYADDDGDDHQKRMKEFEKTWKLSKMYHEVDFLKKQEMDEYFKQAHGFGLPEVRWSESTTSDEILRQHRAYLVAEKMFDRIGEESTYADQPYHRDDPRVHTVTSADVYFKEPTSFSSRNAPPVEDLTIADHVDSDASGYYASHPLSGHGMDHLEDVTGLPYNPQSSGSLYRERELSDSTLARLRKDFNEQQGIHKKAQQVDQHFDHSVQIPLGDSAGGSGTTPGEAVDTVGTIATAAPFILRGDPEPNTTVDGYATP